MRIILFTAYNLFFVPLFYITVQIAGLFNAKIRRGLKGRKRLFTYLRTYIQALPGKGPRVWMHISSMGEYEQGLPVIRALRQRIPKSEVVITFFSPSGYENVTIREDANVMISYIPLDSYWHARKFIDIVGPDAAMVVRHDIWPNHQWRLQARGIPSMLIDASIPDQRRVTYRIFQIFFRQIFKTFSRVCTVSQQSAERLKRVYPAQDRLHVCGDTRYDQVLRRVSETGKIDHLLKSRYFGRRKCLVAGSTWPSDERVILDPIADLAAHDTEFIAIVAPHEPTAEHLDAIESHFRAREIPLARLSGLRGVRTWSFRILLIDRIGLLANLYALGSAAFVGGGFGPGVHNVLEPAAHGCAVMFGPNHLNSVEAQQMVERGGAQVITNPAAAGVVLNGVFFDAEEAAKRGENARAMVLENQGSSERIVDILESVLWKGGG